MSIKQGKQLFFMFALFCSFVSCITRAHGGPLDEPYKPRKTKEYIPTVPVDLENPKTYIRIKSLKPKGLCTEDQIQEIEDVCMEVTDDKLIRDCVENGIKTKCDRK